MWIGEGVIERRIFTAVLLLAAVLPACSSAPSLTATLHVLSGQVEVASGEEDFAPAEDAATLSEGDTVRTSADGRATIEYGDGSLTRLDHTTSFSLTELRGTAGAPRIGGYQSAGNSFHRVVALSASGSRFDVETPTAVAGVQGTEYALFVDPGGATTLVAISDVVIVTAAGGSAEVAEGFAVTVASDGSVGAPAPTPIEFGEGPWLTFNRVEDGLEAPPAPLPGEAFFEASVSLPHIGLNHYPPGARVLAVIREQPGGREIGRGEVEVPREGDVFIQLLLGLRPGHHVTVTYLATGEVRETTVVPLEITLVDSATDTITGTAAPGSVVVVIVADPGSANAELFSVTADGAGAWRVVTTPRVDLVDSKVVTARIADADGDTTLAFEPGAPG